MSGPRTKRGGFTLFELAVVACILGLLAAVLLNRFLTYREEAERVAVKQLIGTLRSALSARSAQLISAGDTQALAALARDNPMRLLSGKPENYLGEFYSPEINKLPRGNWYFDRSNQTLVYLLAGHKSFSGGISNLLIFKVKLAGLPDPARENGAPKATQGLVLDRLIDPAAANK